MSSEELKTAVLEMADADNSLCEEAKLLILGALEGDEMFAEVVRGEAGPIERPTQKALTPAVEPVGAYLRSISVAGFRGVGPELTVPLQPRPGLVVIAGRNGSGKSTVAEALEMALTGESYRWRNRSAVWTGNWRNLHSTGAASIRVDIAEEGCGVTTIGIDWAKDASLEDCSTWVQRAGNKREPGFESLGWAAPIELYRPLLSYDELGGVLDGRPSDLYDKLFVLLGLERVTDARNRLATALNDASAPSKAAKTLAAELKILLLAAADPRAPDARTLISKRVPDVAAVQALVAGTSSAEVGSLIVLRSLAQLTVPTAGAVQAAADQLRLAVAEVAKHAGAAADAADRQADLLDAALANHEQHGDGLCPVCGVGRLDAEWADRSRAALEASRAELAELRAARADLEVARKLAWELIREASVVPDVGEPELTALPAAIQAREAWLSAPADDLPLADHLVAVQQPLDAAFSLVRVQAAQLLTDREDLWAPLAVKLRDWINAQTLASQKAPRVAELNSALTWLKNNAAQLRNQRLAPLVERAKHIWATLRQESNVGLDAIRLEGDANRRRVELDAEVDGVKAGAFGVMSQGELHALALALFLPRAAAPDSSFRFIVLDDPVQAMDPSKVEGFVTVLHELAVDRQIIVLSHDDRLSAAVRRPGIKAQILEVTRGTGSKVVIKDACHPASRYLDDAFAFAKDENIPAEAKNRVIPGLCRMGLETTAHEVYSSRSYSAGLDRKTVEDCWHDASTLRQRLGLALHADKLAPIDSWLKTGPRRSVAFAICNGGVHQGSTDMDTDDVNAVRTAVRDLRASLK